MKRAHLILAACCMALFSGLSAALLPVAQVARQFVEGYERLGVPGFEYDYKNYFSSIPDLPKLNEQEHFFAAQEKLLHAYERTALNASDQLLFDHLIFEVRANLDRVRLETDWVRNGRNIPPAGLSGLKNHEAWYALFVTRFTGLHLTASDIKTYGFAEVQRVKAQIRAIQRKVNMTDSTAFYAYLAGERFLLHDKSLVAAAFAKADSTIRAHLPGWIGNVQLPPVHPMEWPDAGEFTPPGMYLNRADNAYGKDVFQYNFYGSKFNSRSIEWIYMHEAIPGHHLQTSLRESSERDALQSSFIYPGNFEGWACYVEYEGKKLGMYTDPFSELGKWEWDLVRSARLVLDEGIHREGWTRDEALAWWRQHVPGQDAIAVREVTRVTNWPCQALSYKAGAHAIEDLKEKLKDELGSAFDERKFHRAWIAAGMRPPEVIAGHIANLYKVK